VAAPAPSHVPASTYRLQLTKALGFEAAAKLVPYLDRLGITTCYASPVLAARPGSTHGYDTCDHSRISPELGGDVAFEAWADRLHDAGLGLIVDFVPNHMSIHPVANAWWRDVLENGPASEHARAFDIDWQPVKVELELNEYLPAKERGDFSLRMILHGRRVCFARNPACDRCVLEDICPSSRLPKAGRTRRRTSTDTS